MQFESRLPLHKNDTAQLLCRVFVVYIQNDAKHTKTRHISKNFKKTKKVLTNIKSSAIISNVADNTVMRGWRNRQTRTFEGRVGETVPVQVRSLAPKPTALAKQCRVFCGFFWRRNPRCTGSSPVPRTKSGH